MKVHCMRRIGIVRSFLSHFMMANFLSLFFYAHSIITPSSSRHYHSIFDDTNLPRVQDTDMLELYHLRSFPLLLIDTMVGQFSTQISGLALRSTYSGIVVVLQYRPLNFSSCFLPVFDTTDNTSISLIWDNRAEIVYNDKIDTSFWQQSTFLAHVSGVVYKNYVKWIGNYMQSNRLFLPQAICSSEYENDCFSLSQTWETFLSDSFSLFARMSVRINAIIPPRATELRFLSVAEPQEISIYNTTQPRVTDTSPDEDENQEEDNSNNYRRNRIPVDNDINTFTVITMKRSEDAGDSTHSMEIMEYYNNIMSCMQHYQLSDFTSALKSCMSENTAFVHIAGGQYYKLLPKYPYVVVKEYLQDIPSAQFLEGKGVDIVDWTIVALFLFFFLMGFIAILRKMNMWETCSYRNRYPVRSMCCSFCRRGSSLPAISHTSFERDRYESILCSKCLCSFDNNKITSVLRQSTTYHGGAFTRLWGAAVGSSRSHSYSKLSQDEENADKYGVHSPIGDESNGPIEKSNSDSSLEMRSRVI